MTTPPNRSGFKKKQNRKFKKSLADTRTQLWI